MYFIFRFKKKVTAGTKNNKYGNRVCFIFFTFEKKPIY